MELFSNHLGRWWGYPPSSSSLLFQFRDMCCFRAGTESQRERERDTGQTWVTSMLHSPVLPAIGVAVVVGGFGLVVAVSLLCERSEPDRADWDHTLVCPISAVGTRRSLDSIHIHPRGNLHDARRGPLFQGIARCGIDSTRRISGRQ